MSQNTCDCGNVTMLPVKGFELAVDTSALPGCDPMEPGPEGTVLTTRGGELAWEEPAATGQVADYAVGEHWTGARWIDGKKIYRQVVELGALPNATAKYVSFSIAGLHEIVNLWGMSKGSNGYRSLPYGHPAPASCMAFVYNPSDQQFVIATGADQRTKSGRAIIEYTCTDR